MKRGITKMRVLRTDYYQCLSPSMCSLPSPVLPTHIPEPPLACRPRIRALKREELPTLTPPTESHVGDGFVSVVVPAYNEGDGIKLTLATIDELAQVINLHMHPTALVSTPVLMHPRFA